MIPNPNTIGASPNQPGFQIANNTPPPSTTTYHPPSVAENQASAMAIDPLISMAKMLDTLLRPPTTTHQHFRIKKIDEDTPSEVIDKTQNMLITLKQPKIHPQHTA